MKEIIENKTSMPRVPISNGIAERKGFGCSCGLVQQRGVGISQTGKIRDLGEHVHGANDMSKGWSLLGRGMERSGERERK